MLLMRPRHNLPTSRHLGSSPNPGLSTLFPSSTPTAAQYNNIRHASTLASTSTSASTFPPPISPGSVDVKPFLHESSKSPTSFEAQKSFVQQKEVYASPTASSTFSDESSLEIAPRLASPSSILNPMNISHLTNQSDVPSRGSSSLSPRLVSERQATSLALSPSSPSLPPHHHQSSYPTAAEMARSGHQQNSGGAHQVSQQQQQHRYYDDDSATATTLLSISISSPPLDYQRTPPSAVAKRLVSSPQQQQQSTSYSAVADKSLLGIERERGPGHVSHTEAAAGGPSSSPMTSPRPGPSNQNAWRQHETHNSSSGIDERRHVEDEEVDQLDEPDLRSTSLHSSSPSVRSVSTAVITPALKSVPLSDVSPSISAKASRGRKRKAEADEAGLLTEGSQPRRPGQWGDGKAMGYRKGITPDTMIGLNEPTRPKKRAGAVKDGSTPAPVQQNGGSEGKAENVCQSDEDSDGDETDEPAQTKRRKNTLAGKGTVDVQTKRRENTIAARKSRERKLAYVRGLEGALIKDRAKIAELEEDLKAQIGQSDLYKDQCESLLAQHGRDLANLRIAMNFIDDRTDVPEAVKAGVHNALYRDGRSTPRSHPSAYYPTSA